MTVDRTLFESISNNDNESARHSFSLSAFHFLFLPRNVDKEAKDECTLAIDNQKLKPTANLRILGVNIDDKLSFTEHISDICKKSE